ncbi:hypothetical protein [Ramlibacter sp. 2FC]|uniref:hypothetical protein n=1 Tax=Ramlibacter sp. 2FC TaxID=2502188 RepID=UPI0010F67930|nr:hypothetical protein [Ramlibacter sp. 2FC]
MVPSVRPSTIAQPLLACLLGSASLWAGAQTALFEGPLPTRMQFCQQELQGAEGEERRQLLRACLVRRADGERLVLRECRQRLREARVAPAERQRWQRDCEYRALAVHSSELPQTTVAAPEPAAQDQAPADAVAPAAPQLLESAGPVTSVEAPAAP